MSDSNLSASTRPLTITAICVMGLVNATQMISLIMSPVAKQIGALYPAYFLFSVVASVICLAGLWLLKRWAVYCYSALLLINQLVLANMKLWEVSAAIIPFIMIVLLFNAREKMQ